MSPRPTADVATEPGHSRESLTELGRALRETRQKRGEDLYDIADYLKIRPSYLFAIEDGDLDATPGLTYAIGFLRSYADYLGYDAHEMVVRAKRTMAGKREEPEHRYQTAASESRRPSAIVIAASVLFVAGAYGAWHVASESGVSPLAELSELAGEVGQYASEFMTNESAVAGDLGGGLDPDIDNGTKVASLDLGRSDDPAVASDAEVAGLTILSIPIEDPISLQLEATEPPVPTFARRQPQNARIVLLARQASWIQVKSKARDFVRTRTLQAGDRLAVPNRDDLALWTGNAGGVEILLDGESVGVLGEVGAVIEAVPLLPDRLRSRAR